MVAVFDERLHHYHYEVMVDPAVQARRISTNIPFILGSLAMLLVVGLVGFVDQMALGDKNRAAIASNNGYYDRGVKPYIYQFDVVSQDIDMENQGAPPAAVNGVRKIPYIWDQVWASAGWTPKNLMVGKYAAEPQYQEIVNLLSEDISLVQRRHVYKYIAMAAVGGGWLGHSDLFPLHPFGSTLNLPNDGYFTAFDGPSLMSANASEWLRMGRRIAEHANVYSPREQWTEALALSQLQMDYRLQKDEVFEVDNQGKDEVQWVWNAGNDCQRTRTKRAVHFRLGDQEEFSVMHDPGDMVIKWLSMWLQSCEQNPYFIELEQSQLPESSRMHHYTRRDQQLQTATQQGVVQVGSYHVSADYTPAEGTTADETQNDATNTQNDATIVTSEEEQPPIQTGSYHVETDYTSNSTETVVTVNNNDRNLLRGMVLGPDA